MAQGYCDKDCKRVTDGQSRGIQYQCGVCGKYTAKDKDTNPPVGYTEQYSITTSDYITTKEQAIKLFEIDTTKWNVDRFTSNRSEKKEDYYTVKIWVSPKLSEMYEAMALDTFQKNAIEFAPKYPKIKYNKVKVGHLFELDLPDMQLGRLVEAQEAGFEINPDIQIAEAEIAIDKLIAYTQMFEVSRILFPVGNDYFDTNSADMFTKHGTPQLDDVRWKRTFQLGCGFLVKTIEKLMQIAPVDVLVIPGNHDEDKIWYAGEYLDAWFSKCDSVSIDNQAKKRKYYPFENNLIGLTHGYFEKNSRLDSLMAFEEPQLWANSKHREWHLGDKHHKVDMVLKTDELENGVVVRILRSLASPSVWEFDKGLVGSQKAAEAFVWHPEDGVVAQFTASK
jgi:hypothetical protein